MAKNISFAQLQAWIKNTPHYIILVSSFIKLKQNPNSCYTTQPYLVTVAILVASNLQIEANAGIFLATVFFISSIEMMEHILQMVVTTLLLNLMLSQKKLQSFIHFIIIGIKIKMLLHLEYLIFSLV